MLVSPDVPRNRRREVIYAALAEFQDPTSNVMSAEEWLAMGTHHHGGHRE
jgi:hypothetical protein